MYKDSRADAIALVAVVGAGILPISADEYLTAVRRYRQAAAEVTALSEQVSNSWPTDQGPLFPPLAACSRLVLFLKALKDKERACAALLSSTATAGFTRWHAIADHRRAYQDVIAIGSDGDSVAEMIDATGFSRRS